jgi:hypothetical protein
LVSWVANTPKHAGICALKRTNNISSAGARMPHVDFYAAEHNANYEDDASMIGASPL